MQTVTHHQETATTAAGAVRKADGQPVTKEGLHADVTTSAPAALIADLWALFDIACRRTNGLLSTDGQAAISVQRSPVRRRFLMMRDGEPARYITVIPLLPTAHGRVRCGAYIGTRQRCFYVEPAATAHPAGWKIIASDADFDGAAVQDLFLQVFGAVQAGARVP